MNHIGKSLKRFITRSSVVWYLKNIKILRVPLVFTRIHYYSTRQMNVALLLSAACYPQFECAYLSALTEKMSSSNYIYTLYVADFRCSKSLLFISENKLARSHTEFQWGLWDLFPPSPLCQLSLLLSVCWGILLTSFSLVLFPHQDLLWFRKKKV